MPYSTLADIEGQLPEEKIIELTDDEGQHQVNQARVDLVIASADGVIDGYLAKRYAVPFAVPPAAVKACSIDIAIYNLHSRKLGDVPAIIKKRFDDAIQLLKDLAEGVAELPTTELRTDSEAQYGDRIFTRDKMKGF